MKITIFGGIGEIGGNKILVESENKTQIFLDFGRRLNVTAKYYEEFIQPRPKTILSDFLKLNILPRMPNLYRQDLLKKEIESSCSKNTECIPPFKEAPDYWDCSKLIGSLPQKTRVSGIFITHAHFDHIQDICFLRPDIPLYCSEKTQILTETIEAISPSDIGNEFFSYFDYRLSQRKASTQSASRTRFPNTLEIVKEGSNASKVYHFTDPELQLEVDLENPPKKRYIEPINEGKPVKLGSLQIDAIPVDHSVPGALSFLVTDIDSKKKLLYSGDFRFGEPSKLQAFIKKVKDLSESLDAFICEGTRIQVDDIKTEKEIQANLTKKMQEIKKSILIDFNWKDLTRFQTILNSCKAVGRTLLISPKIAYLLFQFHQQFPDQYINPRKQENLGIYLKRRGDLLYSPNDYSNKLEMGYLDDWGRNASQNDKSITRIIHLIDLLEFELNNIQKEHLDLLSDKYKTFLKTLSKEWFGELDEKICLEKLKLIKDLALFNYLKGRRAYEVRATPEKYVLMFTFWDVNELFDLSPENGDMTGSYFIKACTEPFNDEMFIDEKKMMNWLDYFHVTYDKTKEDPHDENSTEIFTREHVSGHAVGSELKTLISQLKPKIIIPIHTLRSDKFKEIGKEFGIKVVAPEYGKEITI